MDATEKPKTDWESIERHYRAGVLSLREIAKQHGVTDGAIRKKAKQLDWQRDLTAKVAEKVRTELVRSEVRTPNARTEQEIVDSAAATVVQVVREHRRDIASGRNIVSLLMGQLVDVAGKRDEFEGTIEVECAEDKTTERRNKLMKAVSIPAHAATVRDLSNAMKNLVGLERQAFNISDVPEPDNQESSVADQVSAGFDELRAAFAKRLGDAGST
jgi:hypothetical protein